MEKIFAIGDIHGCISRLNTMMTMLDINAEKDTLVFIGDYIDRGPDAKGVVDAILDIRRNFSSDFQRVENPDSLCRYRGKD